MINNELKNKIDDLIYGLIFYFIVYIFYIISFFKNEISVNYFLYAMCWYILFLLIVDLIKTKKTL